MLNLGFETCEFGLRMAYFCNVYNILISKKKKKVHEGNSTSNNWKKVLCEILVNFFRFLRYFPKFLGYHPPTDRPTDRPTNQPTIGLFSPFYYVVGKSLRSWAIFLKIQYFCFRFLKINYLILFTGNFNNFEKNKINVYVCQALGFTVGYPIEFKGHSAFGYIILMLSTII